MWEKNKGTTKCGKRTITGDVGTVQYENRTIKCEKIREPPNITKVLSNVMLELHNVMMEPSNMRKNKETIKCNKRTIACNVVTI